MQEPIISQNFRYNGGWNNLKLSHQEIEGLRQLHRVYTNEVLTECFEDALKEFSTTDSNVAVALFEARVEKFFTWIMRALKNKTDKARGNGGYAVDEERVLDPLFFKVLPFLIN